MRLWQRKGVGGSSQQSAYSQCASNTGEVPISRRAPVVAAANASCCLSIVQLSRDLADPLARTESISDGDVLWPDRFVAVVLSENVSRTGFCLCGHSLQLRSKICLYSSLHILSRTLR